MNRRLPSELALAAWAFLQSAASGATAAEPAIHPAPAFTARDLSALPPQDREDVAAYVLQLARQ